MTGYPIYYGDSDDHKVKVSKYQASSLKVLSVALTFASVASPVCAVEPAAEVARNAREVSNASIAITCAVCAGAGAVCKNAAENAAAKNPKLLGAFGCVALMSWCAAKASPL